MSLEKTFAHEKVPLISGASVHETVRIAFPL